MQVRLSSLDAAETLLRIAHPLEDFPSTRPISVNHGSFNRKPLLLLQGPGGHDTFSSQKRLPCLARIFGDMIKKL